MKNTLLISTLAVGTLFGSVAQAELTGNIGAVSKYMFRGGIENGSATVQGGIDYSQESGFYAGYWGSGLGYSDEPGADSNGFENDFYAGFGGELGGGAFYDVGVVAYVYSSGVEGDAVEVQGTIGYGPASLFVAYGASDADNGWIESGDIYFSVNFDYDLPADFSVSAVAGFMEYDDSTKESGFRHADITISHPVGDTGVDASLTYVFSGNDELTENQDNQIFLGFGYGFDI